MRILYSSLHNLNLNLDAPIRKAIPNDFNDYVNAYIQFATAENKSSRAYKPIDENSEVLSGIAAIFSEVRRQGEDVTEKENADLHSNLIAQKLLDVEKKVQERIGQMKDVQKGSIVQALLLDQDSYKYVIAKVEHSEWYDGETLVRNFGFPGDNKRVWKSVVIDLESLDDVVVFKHIKVYVNHTAKYWSADFLEVQEAQTDESNTRRLFQAVEKCLKSVKSTALRDYYNLRNTVLHELQSGQTIDYTILISRLLDTYEPASENVNVSDLKKKLLEAQEEFGFDTQFRTKPDAVKRQGKITIDVSSSIQILVNKGIPNWRDEFLVKRKGNGCAYLMIRCNDPETLNAFPEDEDDN